MRGGFSMDSGRKRRRAQQALQAGDLATAERLLREVCDATPGDGQAWLLLASVCGQGGKFREVLDCCRQGLAVGAPAAPVYSLMGRAHAAMGDAARAVEAHERAVAEAPGDPTVLHALGDSLLGLGRVEGAVEQYQRALARAPGFPAALFGLACASRRLGRLGEAVRHFRKVIAAAPMFLDAYVGLGEVLTHLHDFVAAEKCFREALTRWSMSPALSSGLRFVLVRQGRFDEALEVVGEALRHRPGDAEALAGEADILERQGDLAAAYQRVRRLVDGGQVTVGTVEVYGAICRTYGSCEEVIALCHELLAGSGGDRVTEERLQFLLGRVHDGRGEYDDAFRAYARANALSLVRYDHAAHVERVDQLIAAFTRQAIAKMARATVRSDRPLFIVGMPRSGTSLVEQILASHPQVFGGGELREVNQMVRALPASLYPEGIGGIEREQVDHLAGVYLDRLAKLSPDAWRVTDKMPHNFLHLGLIALLFPAARVVHCQRDARDTCLSIYFQSFGPGHQYATDLRSLGLYYREYERLMAHWRGVVGLPIMQVRYEELVADPERTSRELIAFAGLDWDDRCLQFHQAERAVVTASYDQVRRPIYTGSVGRWRSYERHLGPLLEALGDG